MVTPSLRRRVYGLLALLGVSDACALTFDAMDWWIGSGTNRAALVIQWNHPEVLDHTTVPVPVVNRSMAWGYRFDGTGSARQMLEAILERDPRLFAIAGPGGHAILAFGYDLDHDGVFAVTDGTQTYGVADFAAGPLEDPTFAVDASASTDDGDLYWAGSAGPSWLLWHEQGGAGGFSRAPDRGPDPCWTYEPVSRSGNHGEWRWAEVDLSDLTLADGTWVGWSVAAGGLDPLDPANPGTVAWRQYNQAPAPPRPAPAPGRSDAFAADLIAAQGPFGPPAYDDPASVLGAPSTDFYDPSGVWSGGAGERRTKLIEAAHHLDPTQTRKLITTLLEGSVIVSRFEQPIHDDPAHPYGIDLLVFGNAFYTGNGTVNDQTDLNTHRLTGLGTVEPLKLSVSPGYTGQPGQSRTNWQTWDWYRYDHGPYADSAFPTQGYVWDRTNAAWTTQFMDFTKPVNPALEPLLSAPAALALSAADAIDLYTGSGGGTGFDLRESGFTSIQYVKVEGLPGFSGGEVDAFAAVRPAVLGDALSLAPGNLALAPAKLIFQQPEDATARAVTLELSTLDQVARISAGRMVDPILLAAVSGTVRNAVELDALPLLGSDPVTFRAKVGLAVGEDYEGAGEDLEVLRWENAQWIRQSFVFDASAHEVALADLIRLGPFVLTQVDRPQLVLARNGNIIAARFKPVPDWTHTLERTLDLNIWTEVDRETPNHTQPVALEDSDPPLEAAFYRLRLTRP